MYERLVIIPTYNEIENIERVIKNVFAQDVGFDILVVDDFSPDGTADVVKQLQLKYYAQLHLIVRQEKDAVWVVLISPAFSGLYRKIITIFLKWMLTILIIQMTSSGSIMLVTKTGLICLLVLDISMA